MTPQPSEKVTSKEVARLAGVTQPTVSRALRDDPRVAEDTKKRVRKAAAKLGYHANVLGRSLSTQVTRQVAMVADLENPLYPALVPAVHDELAANGYRMVLLSERGDEMSLYERLLDRSVDGAVLTTTRHNSSLAAELSERGLPFVFLNRVHNKVDGDAAVAANYDGASATAHLFIESGHRRIAAILGPEVTSTSQERERGFRDAMGAAGLVLPESRVHHGWFTYRHGVEGFDAVMRGRHKPTAVFCITDMVAVGVINTAMERGLRVPDDLAVIGFDDIDMASWPMLQLSTIRTPLQAMAKRAAQMLIERLQGTATGPPRREELPVSLVLRRTHG